MSSRNFLSDLQPCPCLSGRDYCACCGPYLEGQRFPETAERLMRSRYTAYTFGRGDYLLATWHPRTRPFSLDLDAAVKWLGLEVLRKESGGADDSEGVVEFVARYKINGRAQRLREISCFLREDGRWLYVEGSSPLKT